MAGVNVFIETDRLMLRRFTVDDLGLLVELDSDPEVKRYIDNGAAADPTSTNTCLVGGLAMAASVSLYL